MTLAVSGADDTGVSAASPGGFATGFAHLVANDQTEGFIYHNGALDVLNVPGAIVTLPFAINDSGQATGVYTLDGENYFAFVATPVPEPSTWSMMVAGLVLMCGAMRTRSRKVHLAKY